MASVTKISCLFAGLLAIIRLASSATGVCQRTESATETYQVYVSVSSRYSTNCYLFWRCSKTRYRAVTELRTRPVYSTVPVCCDGYEGDGVQCTPICTGGCSERGTCVAPDVCQCQVGWTGSQCSEDIDECEVDAPCSNCTNTEGSFQCTCPDGTVLPPGQSCVDQPQMVSANFITSNSIFISWKAPNISESDGNLQNYDLSCSASEDNEHMFVVEQTMFNVTSLLAHTVYTCCVKARTTAGLSPKVCLSISTLEDAPSSPPENVAVEAVSPFAVEIEWATPAIPNGVITHYNVYTFTGPHVDTVDGSQRNYVHSGLSPYENVTVCVSASTSVGEGPKSPPVSVKTRESAPSGVESMEVEVVSDTSFRVSWTPPRTPNGVLTEYWLTVINLVTGNSSLTLLSPSTLEATITSDIEPFVPYEISVRAATSAGVGEADNIITFTREGIPVASPPILSLQRTDATSALIQWDPLRPQDLRGNLTSYQIVYFQLGDGCPSLSRPAESHEIGLSVEALLTAFPLRDLLEPGQQYCVGIAAVTGAGTGDFSYKSLSWFNSTRFSVVIQVTSCSQWIEELPASKAKDLVAEISRGIEQYCQCVFPSDYITDTAFVCDKSQSGIVIFQGRIIGTDDRDSVSLWEDLQQWVSNEPKVSVQGKQVQVVSPSNEGSTQDSDTSSATIGVSIAAVLILLLGLTAFVVAFIAYLKHKQKCSKQRTEKQEMDIITSTTSSEDPTIKDLKNPYYGYGVHALDDGQTEEGYSSVTTEKMAFEAVANPSYGVTEAGKGKEPISNPLYGLNGGRSQPAEVATSAGSGLYSEIPVSRRERIYETTHN